MAEELALKPSEKATKVFTSQDKLRKENPFYPTYLEWLRKHAVQVLGEYSTNASGTHVVYTVPKNHTLYLTSATLHGQITLTSDSFTSLQIGSTNVDLLRMRFGLENHQDNQTINYSNPIIIVSGDSLDLTITNNMFAGATIQGFLVQNNLIPQF